MNFWKWLTGRALKLPAAKNSISDVLGDDYADYFRNLAEPFAGKIAAEITGLLAQGLISAGSVVVRARAELVNEIQKRIGRPLSDKVEGEIDAVLTDALGRLPSDFAAVEKSIREALLKGLRL